MYDYCPVCGSDRIIPEVVTEVFEYKGRRIPVENYRIYRCERCGEAVVDRRSRRRSEAILRDAQRAIDGFLTSAEIKRIRKSFGMTQEEFSAILGGGEKAFARYETGRVLQSKPMDSLLRVLRAYPDAMELLRKGNAPTCATGAMEYNPHEEPASFEYVMEESTIRRLPS